MKFELSADKGNLKRTFTIPSDATFEDMSEVIQAMMGWTDLYPHRFIIGDAILGPPQIMKENKNASPESEYLLSDFRIRKMVYEYGSEDRWKLVLKPIGEADQGDGSAHLLSFSGPMPGEFLTPDEYGDSLAEKPFADEDGSHLREMAEKVESVRIAAIRGGKYIDISAESMADIWKALTSHERYPLYFDMANDTVRALVSSPREKRVGWSKVLDKEYKRDPNRFIPIRGAENTQLFEMAEKFRSMSEDGIRSMFGPQITDRDSYLKFIALAEKSGQAMAWHIFLESNRAEIVGRWAGMNSVRIIEPDPVSKLVRRSGIESSDDVSILTGLNNLLQSFSVSSEPIVCQSCGAPINPKMRSDLPPSTVGGIPYQQCSSVCSCGKDNVLLYLNDGYHSGYHYKTSTVPWFEYAFRIDARKRLKNRISSDEEASDCIFVMREALRCCDWKEFGECDSRLRKYFGKVPEAGSEQFRLYAKWVNLSSAKNTDAMAGRLDSLIQMASSLGETDRAESYALKCQRMSGYEGCPEKALELLGRSDADPYERGYILTLMSPMIANAEEPEGYGDMLVSIFGEIVGDLEKLEFRRRWQLSVAALVMEFSCGHAHKEGDWDRVLPLLERMEKAVKDMNAEKSGEAEEDEPEEESGGEAPIDEALRMAFERLRGKWKPSPKCNGLTAAVMLKLGSYYLTDGSDTRKGYSIMKGIYAAAEKWRDFGPVTVSRLILSEAVAYRSDRRQTHLDRSIQMLSALGSIVSAPTELYGDFILYATADLAGTSEVLRTFAAYGLPFSVADRPERFDPDNLWLFPTEMVV